MGLLKKAFSFAFDPFGITSKLTKEAGNLLQDVTGVSAQIEATKQNAAAQAMSIKQAAAAQQANLIQAAQAAATQQSQIAARAAAEATASEAASAPLGTADVQLDPTQTDTVSAARAKKRASFGRNYGGGGVSI